MNGIIKNATIAVPLKYLSYLWRSLEMSLVNCKVELKLKWPTSCISSAAGADNINGNDNNIILTIKDIKSYVLCSMFLLYVLVVTLSARYNQKLSKHRTKGFEISVY